MPARKGFTLIEVVLVMVIVVMLAAIIYPSLETMYADVRVSAASDNLRARFAEARSRAIEEQRPYRFAVKANSGNYRVAPDSPDQWGEPTNAQDQSRDAGTPAPLVVEDTLPSEILFQFGAGSAPAADSSGWSTVVTFLPNGECSEDCTIRLERDGARAIEISVRALTGSVTAKSLKPGG